MSIHQLFCELDELILRNFGDLESTLRTEPGQRLFQQILSEKNREQLRAWYKKPLGSRQLNSLAIEIKQKLESELGEDL